MQAPHGAGPFSDPFTDLSEEMPHEYQLLDVASRTIKKAVETGSFYKEPEMLAGLREIIKDIDRMVVSYNDRRGADITAAPMGDEGKIVESDDSEDGGE
jgi:hypothetical protein